MVLVRVLTEKHLPILRVLHCSLSIRKCFSGLGTLLDLNVVGLLEGGLKIAVTLDTSAVDEKSAETFVIWFDDARSTRSPSAVNSKLTYSYLEESVYSSSCIWYKGGEGYIGILLII